MIGRVFDGKAEGLTRDDVLDNITLYWLTNTGISSGRLKLPVGVSAFADEIYQAPESWAKRAYAQLLYYKAHPKGGHFAAWEQPDRLVSDLRATFQSQR